MEHEKAKVQKSIESLSEEQQKVLLEWILVNAIDKESLTVVDDLLNGIRIFGDSQYNAEVWEIDFVFRKADE